ncbi:UBP-type zinc finger domain-containing protein [Calidifontibacter sp. DB0510]|uniref:UBP-type zinc finger domain-containing protein n=1 Tax=Metallococcus carri TaxID=1656884 RepID=A0A967EFZ4_9MICO|nr:UBP-type zinc finger domain-containing protein [Metallococcus carri]NHN57076.1 UBP-type zinc finger domain-containing protein [Metallococcus carri]NOP39055.1 UBP-type zinc finger domain-containing protein [Calidifontibacter sp. DB2511S]
MDNESAQIDPSIPPSGTGCAECLASPDGWWVHLRRCAACGHIGCCDTSPSQHATAHAKDTGHRIMTSFEPGEDWFYDYGTGEMARGPQLAPPSSRPTDQPVPAPAGRVPDNWRELIH